MARKYFTLLVREHGQWTPQFGDFDRDSVEYEADDLASGFEPIKRRDIKIISTGSTQTEIDSVVQRLNDLITA